MALPLLLVLLALFLSGCSFLGSLVTPGSNANVAAELVVEEATAVAIQHGCSSQACYDANAEKVLVVANVLKIITVQNAMADVTEALTKEIVKLNLSPEELPPMQALLTTLINYITPMVPLAGAIAAPGLVVVNTVATWVGQEAALYSPEQAIRAGYYPKVTSFRSSD
jgi:hypothetical protein